MNSPNPLLIVFAGPNGAGKTTLRNFLFGESEVPFINADEIAAKGNLMAYEAAKIATQMRSNLVKEGRSFMFETVLSDPVGDKVTFLSMARDLGYQVEVHFIGLPSPDFSLARVIQRVMEGGHDVPDDKIKGRYPRVLQNLERLVGQVSTLTIYDNSDAEDPYQVLARFEGENLVELASSLPDWISFLHLPSFRNPDTQLLS